MKKFSRRMFLYVYKIMQVLTQLACIIPLRFLDRNKDFYSFIMPYKSHCVGSSRKFIVITCTQVCMHLLNYIAQMLVHKSDAETIGKWCSTSLSASSYHLHVVVHLSLSLSFFLSIYILCRGRSVRAAIARGQKTFPIVGKN